VIYGQLESEGQNAKYTHESLVPYEKDDIDSNKNGLDGDNSMDNTPLIDGKALSGSEFLLSIAGMFSTGSTNTSEDVEQHVAQAIKKKYA